jgi:hypothetical protein
MCPSLLINIVVLDVCYFDCFKIHLRVSKDKVNLSFLIIKPTRCTISQIYFGVELYMFRTDLLSIIRSLVLYTQQ